MGEIFSRFPHVGIQILDNLNDKDLQRCCYVSHSWNNFVKSEKFWWMRIIKRIVKELNQNYTDCPRIWSQMFKQIETETVKIFAKKIKLEHEMLGNDLFGHSNAYADAISFVLKKQN